MRRTGGLFNEIKEGSQCVGGAMSKRTPFIVGNWKMYKTVAEAREALAVLRGIVGNIDGVDCGVAPPFPALEACASISALPVIP